MATLRPDRGRSTAPTVQVWPTSGFKLALPPVYWSARVEGLLQASVRDRPFVPGDQVLDVRFHEFMADEMSMVKRIYEFAEQSMTEDMQRAVKSFMAANPRGRLGRIAYHLEDFGLDLRERRQALRFYQEGFDVPDE